MELLCVDTNAGALFYGKQSVLQCPTLTAQTDWTWRGSAGRNQSSRLQGNLTADEHLHVQLSTLHTSTLSLKLSALAKAWKCAGWEVSCPGKTTSLVGWGDTWWSPIFGGSAQPENFRFNAGSTIFRIRVLSAISMVRRHNQTLSLNSKNYGVLGCKLIRK